MNREKIIKLANDYGLTDPDWVTVWPENLERFVTAIEAEQAEIIAAQQARIAALVEALNFALVEYAPSNQGIIKRVLSEITDDLSALHAECKRHYELGKEQALSDLPDVTRTNEGEIK